jgi:hypothetical protein
VFIYLLQGIMKLSKVDVSKKNILKVSVAILRVKKN